MPAKKKATKPVAKPVPSDDCRVIVDGVEYFPHVGETVTAFRGMTVGQIVSWRKMTEAIEQQAVAQGDKISEQEAANNVSNVVADTIETLSKRIVDWTWTGVDGKPLPKPWKNPDAFDELLVEELVYLMDVVKGETEIERGNV